MKVILNNEPSLAKADVLRDLCERLDFAGQRTRYDDFSSQIFDERDGTFKPDISAKYLLALNLLEKRTDIVDWDT